MWQRKEGFVFTRFIKGGRKNRLKKKNLAGIRGEKGGTTLERGGGWAAKGEDWKGCWKKIRTPLEDGRFNERRGTKNKKKKQGIQSENARKNSMRKRDRAIREVKVTLGQGGPSNSGFLGEKKKKRLVTDRRGRTMFRHEERNVKRGGRARNHQGWKGHIRGGCSGQVNGAFKVKRGEMKKKGQKDEGTRNYGTGDRCKMVIEQRDFFIMKKKKSDTRWFWDTKIRGNRQKKKKKKYFSQWSDVKRGISSLDISVKDIKRRGRSLIFSDFRMQRLSDKSCRKELGGSSAGLTK